MIRFNCDACGRSLNIADEKAGMRGKCPGCGASLVVPTAVGTPPHGDAPNPIDPTPACNQRSGHGASPQTAPTPPARAKAVSKPRDSGDAPAVMGLDVARRVLRHSGQARPTKDDLLGRIEANASSCPACGIPVCEHDLHSGLHHCKCCGCTWKYLSAEQANLNAIEMRGCLLKVACALLVISIIVGAAVWGTAKPGHEFDGAWAGGIIGMFGLAVMVLSSLGSREPHAPTVEVVATPDFELAEGQRELALVLLGSLPEAWMYKTGNANDDALWDPLEKAFRTLNAAGDDDAASRIKWFIRDTILQRCFQTYFRTAHKVSLHAMRSLVDGGFLTQAMATEAMEMGPGRYRRTLNSGLIRHALACALLALEGQPRPDIEFLCAVASRRVLAKFAPSQEIRELLTDEQGCDLHDDPIVQGIARAAIDRLRAGEGRL